MSEYKPITGELRDSMTYDITTTPNGVSTASIDTVEFVNICDTIDAIHANLERENESLKAELDRARDEWDFWESTHVELPKDADGEHIHIGDVMECEKLPNGNRVCGEVKAIGDGYVWLMNVQYKIRAEYLRHHAPTVEDVLREMLDAWGELPSNVTNDAIVAEYAKRLTLAGDAE